jgi:hypothetical protein
MKDPANTFRWLVSILKAHDVPFVVAGGLAAKSYGSPRPLNDIDIDIRNEDFPKLLPAIAPYALFGPARYRDEKWDILLATLEHDGQEIDIAGGHDAKLYDDKAGRWVDIPCDFSRSEPREIFGVSVPVVSPEELIAYKSLLNGLHQRVDIEAAVAFLGERRGMKGAGRI